MALLFKLINAEIIDLLICYIIQFTHLLSIISKKMNTEYNIGYIFIYEFQIKSLDEKITYD